MAKESGATGVQRLHARVTGRVQGVFFRASVRERAESLGLTGWVRNCPDGTVELVAEGTKEALQALLAFCHVGPPGARVSGVEEAWETSQGSFDRFRIR